MKKAYLLLASLLVPFALTTSAFAWSPFTGINCGKAQSSAYCQDRTSTQDPLTGNNGLLMKITNILAMVAGIAAVIIIILAGMRFVTSGGSSDDVAGARRTIIYATVGLIIIALGRWLITLVISRL